jgi:hypothetical protein
MELSAPAVGALTGIAIVLFIGIVARRSEQRAQEQRLRILQEKIERRQAVLAARADGQQGSPQEEGSDE